MSRGDRLARNRGAGMRRRAAERDVRARLHATRAPGEAAARERALGRVLEAHMAAPVAARRRGPRAVLVIAAVLLAVVIGGGLTAPGQAVGEWIRDHVAPQPKQRPAPAVAVPGGRVLAIGTGVSAAGEKLGPYRDATWSPHGRFAAVTTRDALLAVTPGGAVRWRVATAATPRRPAWAPDGFTVAYLAGPQLRLVAGDGTDDRLFWGHARDVAPAFRPGAPHSIAWVERDGHVRLADIARVTLEWRSPRAVSRGARTLSWSSDGTRLLAGAMLFDLARGTAREIHPHGRLTAAAFPPTAGPPALLERRGGRSAIRLLGTADPLISTAGRYRGLAWSPDGRWLLTEWEDQWLYVRRDGRRVVTVPSQGRPVGWVR